jgi:hypothetical protein
MMPNRSIVALFLATASAVAAPFPVLADDKPAPRAVGSARVASAPSAVAPVALAKVDPAPLLKIEAPLAREEQRRLAALAPADRAKIASGASTLRARLAKAPAPNQRAKAVDEHARDVAVLLGASSGADIEAIAFLVMMEAAKAAREDLKSIMAGVRAINDAKTCKRRACVTSLKAPTDVDRAAYDAKLAEVADKLDSLSDLGELESLRLQMAMDRMSKMMTTLTELLRKIADTSAAITTNLK